MDTTKSSACPSSVKQKKVIFYILFQIWSRHVWDMEVTQLLKKFEKKKKKGGIFDNLA